MYEILEGVGVQEFYLCITRVLTLIGSIDMKPSKKVTVERIALYDFYLKYPELINYKESMATYDTLYSYFHWMPNYNLYSAVLSNLNAKGLVLKVNNNYIISKEGKLLLNNLNSVYFEKVKKTSAYIDKKIIRLTDKVIKENINSLLEVRGY